MLRYPPIEALESRYLLATISVNAGSVVRTVNDDALGVNLAWWDTNLNTAQTKSMVQAAGLTSFRFPGGSSSDEFHFTDPPSYNGKGTIATFAKFIESVNGGGMVTLDYGSGSPQEAAAMLAYLNASTTNTTSIGNGQTWVNNAWVTKDWKTAGYWASIRAAAPLATDDGLNFLRISHPAPFAFHHYEIGNEVYGSSWETDHHTPAHDPATYVAFAKQFAALSQNIDSSISIGLAIVAGTEQNNWTSNVLTQCAAQSYTPGFLVDHNYVYGPGQENDNTLLHSVSVAGYSGWASRAASYRTLMQQKLGSAAANVKLLATEFNSVYTSPGKQTTSLVNGLFVADAIGSILQTEYDGAWLWDLRNSYETGNNNSSSLYGWRTGGDYGILGTTNGTAPQSGVYVPYPTYFAEQLASKFVRDGASVVSASSNDTNLAVYAVKQTSGKLSLLVINKSSSSSLTGNFQLSGFGPSGAAQFWQYGKTEDTAQSQTADGHASATSFSQNLTITGNTNFSYTFPSYSMTVIELDSVPPPQVIASSYPVATRPDAVTFTFNVDLLTSSLQPGDLTLTRDGSGPVPTVQSVSWDAATKTATFNLTPGQPANANYHAMLAANSVSNYSNNANASSATLDYYFLAGDGDRSRTVDIQDFNLLAINFGKSGQTFTQGNYDYSTDGQVTILDFNILAVNFGGHVDQANSASQTTAITSSSFTQPSFAAARNDSDLLDLI